MEVLAFQTRSMRKPQRVRSVMYDSAASASARLIVSSEDVVLLLVPTGSF